MSCRALRGLGQTASCASVGRRRPRFLLSSGGHLGLTSQCMHCEEQAVLVSVPRPTGSRVWLYGSVGGKACR